MSRKTTVVTFANGSTMTLKVLSKEELEKLLRVKTTIKQGKQILFRNTNLLDDTYNDDYRLRPSRGECPHCSTGFPCDSLSSQSTSKDCAWKKYEDNWDSLRRKNPHARFSFYCCAAKFGGTSYLQKTISDFITLAARYARIDADFYYLTTTDYAKKQVRRFLKGHIEWAEVIIGMGGSRNANKIKITEG